MRNGILGWENKVLSQKRFIQSTFVVCGKNITIYMDPNVAPFYKSSQSHHKALYGRSQLNAHEIDMLVNAGKYFHTFIKHIAFTRI